jgi:hypothetical protein
MTTEEFCRICESMIGRLDGEHTLLGDLRLKCTGVLQARIAFIRECLVDVMDDLEGCKQYVSNHPDTLHQ